MKLLQTFFIFLAFTFDCYGLVWPTPNPAFAKGESIESFVQATGTGNVSSGLYGMVREKGTKFHEGLDLYGIQFDANKEVLDPIFAVLPGKVVHVNEDSSKSSFGIYIVLSHKTGGLNFYSLYAHLDSVDNGISLNHFIKEGTRLGRMGNTAGGYKIPESRAHLHFEIGVQLSDNFQSWFKSQSFKTKNLHRDWNGLNLLGVDPLDFYQSIRKNQSVDFKSYIKSLPKVLSVKVRSHTMPFFIHNNPSFLEANGLSKPEIAGWEITFAKYGIPILWKALAESELNLKNGTDIKLTRYNPDYDFGVEPALFVKNSSGIVLSNELLLNIEKLFF
tara:strand:- start:1795 stop:2790 length:996 start_codon:yes stop_codon:yes gene_type:complete